MNHLNLAEAALRGVLPRYGIADTAGVELIKYRENHVFRIDEIDGRSYAARIHRIGYRTADELATEASYLHLLASRELAVPRLVPTLEGALNCTAALGGEQVVIDLQAWIQDAAPMGDIAWALDGDTTLGERDFHALGRELGRLHRVGLEIGIPEDFTRGAWDADGLAGPEPLWGHPQNLPTLSGSQHGLLTEATRRLHAHLRALPRDREHFGVIHADLTPENVLITPDGPTLIDFDDFGTGWHLFDLVTALFFYTRHPLLEQYRRGLVCGYLQERGEVPAGFFAPWNQMLLARGLTYLGWAAQRHGDEEAGFIQRRVAPLVLQLAEEFLAEQQRPVRPGAP